jgi:hypothetical protein
MNRSTLLRLTASSLLFAAPALAQVSTSAQDAMTPPGAVYMHNVPYGTSGGSDGQYVESGTYYNNAPVYRRVGSTGTTWSLYKRTNGNWYVDFNTVSEDWDGTVAYTAQAQEWPWSDSTWNNNVVSFRTAKVNVQGIAYATSGGSAGDYAFSGQIYNSAPVYTRQGGGTTWSLYKRANGIWVVDFNTVSEDWDGTVAYTNAAEWPWKGTWNGTGLAFRTKAVYLYGVPYTNLGSSGEYVFNGQMYNNAPVYQRMVSGSVWSVYKRADGKWYVDFDALSESWDGTVAHTAQAQAWPWTNLAWANNVISFRTARGSMAGAAYASLGSAGEYVFTGQIYNNAPVYQRQGSSTTWSLYKRANGNWHVDFNAISEDWDGTIAYSTQASTLPWDISWSGSTVSEALFAED